MWMHGPASTIQQGPVAGHAVEPYSRARTSAGSPACLLTPHPAGGAPPVAAAGRFMPCMAPPRPTMGMAQAAPRCGAVAATVPPLASSRTGCAQAAALVAASAFSSPLPSQAGRLGSQQCSPAEAAPTPPTPTPPCAPADAAAESSSSPSVLPAWQTPPRTTPLPTADGEPPGAGHCSWPALHRCLLSPWSCRPGEFPPTAAAPLLSPVKPIAPSPEIGATPVAM